MSDWTELPGFPRTFASQCAPWGDAVRFVNGVRSIKNGKPESLRGARAFLQRLEFDLLAGHRDGRELLALLDHVFTTHARHLDAVEWARVRGDELDLSLRVYATRGSQRLHLSLTGPVGRYADEPLPERAAPAKPRAAKKAAPSPAPAVLPPIDRLPPPAVPLHLRPLVEAAKVVYGDAIAFDRDGRVHVPVTLADGDAFACVDPTGAVTLTTLPTRDDLRAREIHAMTRAMLPGVLPGEAGVLRVDHYETTAGMQERITLAGRTHTGRRGLYDACWLLGVHGEWFLRAIVHDKKATLVGVHLASDRRTRVALPDLDLRGAAVDRGPDGPVLRLLHGDSDERRHRLRTGPKLELDPTTTTLAHALPGLVQPVPDSAGWVAAEGRTLRFIRHGRTTDLFTLPPSFTAPDYNPWGDPLVTQLAFTDAPAWQVDLDFGSDHGPRCRGALVFTADGAVRGCTYTDTDATLECNGARVPLAEHEHIVGVAAGPAGDLAVLLADAGRPALYWAPPPR